MLSPEYLDSIGGEILAMYEELNATVIEDMARRIVKTNMVDSTTAFQMSQMQQAGALFDDTIQRISETTGFTTKELQQLFVEAGTENVRYENDIMQQAGLMPLDLRQSEPMMRQLKAGIDKTSRLIRNMTMTTAVAAQSAYIQASTLAYNQVITGTFSYTQAIRRAVMQSASGGLSVLYPTGHRDKLDVAIRRAVLTGVNQTAAKVTETMADECECDYVETTAHSGARESHALWQGRVFCRSGKDKKYPPFRETGYGTGEGLCGWNCRHSFHMFWPGISEENYTQEMLDDYNAKNFEWNGKKLSDAECNSIQRGYERGIRETKRQLTALNESMGATKDADLKAGFKEDFQKLSVKLKQQESQLKIFCEDTFRQSSAGRTSIAVIKGVDGKILGFNKSVAQKVVWANKGTTELARQGKNMNYGTLETFDARDGKSNSIIKPINIVKEMNKSEVGKELLEYIQNTNTEVRICYGVDNPRNLSGQYDPIEEVIYVYADVTRTIDETTKTVIHEATHKKYNIGDTKKAEVRCFLNEILHEKGKLTIDDIKRTIKTVNNTKEYEKMHWR